MIPNNSFPFDVAIGLDRSDRVADLHLIDLASGLELKETISTSPESLRDWIQELRQRFPKARIAICLERPAGNLMAFLSGFDFITLYAINPITLLKYREAFVTSRAKDDALDAKYLAELLIHHYAQLPVWEPEDEPTRRLQRLVVDRRAVVDHRTGLSNRLKALLKDFFPQALLLAGDELWRPLGTAFLLKWPTLQSVRKSRTPTLMAFYHKQGSRSQSLLEKRLALIERAVALTEDPAILESYTLRAQLTARELQIVVKTIKEYDARIAAAFHDHPDRPIFSSLPGCGPVLAPRLLASVGSRRQRFGKAANLLNYSAIAPVLKQSGNKHHVHRRYLCSKFLRQGFHEYAKESLLHCRWAAAFYRQQRDKGSRHHVAVRALAYKWIRIIWRCWQDRMPYDDARYETALKKNGSPLAGRWDNIELGKSPVKKTVNKSKKCLGGSPQR